MPVRIFSFLFAGLLWTTLATAQQQPSRPAAIDSTLMDDEMLFNELDALLDSLTAPRNFALFNIAVGASYFNYESSTSYLLHSSKKMTCTPTLAYYSKTGLGISGTTVIVNDGKAINPYQVYLTASYDYLKNSSFLTGIAFTHFFTKDSLRFYTSPLKKEIYTYFTYKKSWFKPSVALSYGWGTRSDYEDQEDYIIALRLGLKGFTRVKTKESVNDLNLLASVRHDFYWMDVFSANDYFRLTPQLVFTSGTQKFGFNQTSNSYATVPRTGANVLYNSDKVYLDDQLYFQPLSLSAYVKTEYTKGHFFVQPQLVFDYYFPATDKNFTTAFIMNAGVIF